MPTTPCPSIELLERAASGAGGDVEAHAAECAACRRRIESLKENLAFLDDLARLTRLTRHRTAVPSAGAPAAPDGYELLEELSRGGQGVVYRAVRTSLGRTVALKLLRHGTIATDRQRRRFDRETELAARLRHPGIVAVHDRGVTGDGVPFLAMELIEGCALDVHLRRIAPPPGTGPRSPAAVLVLFREMGSALAAAHRHGVIHRDLKPGNVLVDEHGRPHVVDFGIAKAIADADAPAPAVTRTGEFTGTLAYAAPEQLTGDPDLVDVRTDVYALAVMLYEAVAGSPPYSIGESLGEAVWTIVTQDPAPPRRRARADPAAPYRISSDLETVLLRALAKTPAKRYASMDAFVEDLERLLDGRPVNARRQSRLYLLRKTIARHPTAAASITLGLLLLVIAASATFMLAGERGRAIDALERRAEIQSERLRAADARRSAFVEYDRAVDLIRRGVRPDEARARLDRAIEIDPTFAAAYLERGRLLGPALLAPVHEAQSGTGDVAERSAQVRRALRTALGDFDRAHLLAGGDWLVEPGTGRRLAPDEARGLPADEAGRLVAFPDVVRHADGSLTRGDESGESVPVGGPGLPRALVSAGSILARSLANSSLFGSRRAIEEVMRTYFTRAAALDPDDVYTRISPALAAAAGPADQVEAAERLDRLADDVEAQALVEVWLATAEVRLGGPRRLLPEFQPQRDPRRAEDAARRALGLTPHDPYAWYLLGLSLQDQGRYREAAVADDRALVIVEGARGSVNRSSDASVEAPLRTNLATCHSRLGQVEDVNVQFGRALELSGGSGLVLIEQAEALLRSGRRMEARAALEAARNAPRSRLLKSELPVVWTLLTFPEPTFRDPAGARWRLAWFDLHPAGGDDPLVDVLGVLAVAMSGDGDGAVERAAALPADTRPRPFRDAVRAFAFAAAGRTAEARSHLDRAEAAVAGRPFCDERLRRFLDEVRGRLSGTRPGDHLSSSARRKTS